MAIQIGGTVRGVSTDTIIFEGDINVPSCNKDIIGGIRFYNMHEYNTNGI